MELDEKEKNILRKALILGAVTLISVIAPIVMFGVMSGKSSEEKFYVIMVIPVIVMSVVFIYFFSSSKQIAEYSRLLKNAFIMKRAGIIIVVAALIFLQRYRFSLLIGMAGVCLYVVGTLLIMYHSLTSKKVNPGLKILTVISLISIAIIVIAMILYLG
jgi:hypothetical protein